jgi:hypothetical protein
MALLTNLTNELKACGWADYGVCACTVKKHKYIKPPFVLRVWTSGVRWELKKDNEYIAGGKGFVDVNKIKEITNEVHA